jgi:hypothetical protein
MAPGHMHILIIIIVVVVAVPFVARLVGFVFSAAFWLFLLVVMFELAGALSH